MRQSIISISVAACLIGQGCSTILSSASGEDSYGRHTTSRIAPLGDYRLPKALVRVQLLELKSGGQTLYGFRIEPPDIVGDPAHSYLLDYRASGLSKDTVEVQIEPERRLLRKVSFKAEDKTSDIIVEIAKIVPLFTGAVPLPTGAIGAESTGGEAPKIRAIYDVEIDPADPRAFGEIVEKARALSVKAGGNRFAKIAFEEGPAANFPDATREDCAKGVCYRVPHEYTMIAELHDARGEFLSRIERKVIIPNRGRIVALPLDRAAFIEKVGNYDFAEGVLVRSRVEDDSPVLVVAGLPIRVLSGILGSTKSLLTDQSAAIDAQKAIIESRTSLVTAENARIAEQTAQIEALNTLAATRSAAAAAVAANNEEKGIIDSQTELINAQTAQITALKSRDAAVAAPASGAEATAPTAAATTTAGMVGTPSTATASSALAKPAAKVADPKKAAAPEPMPPAGTCPGASVPALFFVASGDWPCMPTIIKQEVVTGSDTTFNDHTRSAVAGG